MTKPPKRPAVRYHGAKWRLASWIIRHFPEHRCYVEPFGGGASVLLQKARCYAEVYNDLDGEIVNVFRMLRDRGSELRGLLYLTPFSRKEFLQSYIASPIELEQARRTIVRSFQGFGSASVCKEISGFRSNSNRSHTTPAHDWKNYPDNVPALIERFRGVVIEQRDATEVILAHDSIDTLHYIDPPYVHATRSKKKRGTDTEYTYKHEMTDQQHLELAQLLHTLKGFVVLSGYQCDLYDDLYRGWTFQDVHSFADGARPRIERLWLNARARMHQPQGKLI